MTSIAQSSAPVVQESIASGGPVSQSAISAIGAVANFCLANVLPVGSIIPSMLDLSTFQTETGTNWVLADGASHVGSQYNLLTGQTNVPDLRGAGMRGKNNGRSDGYQNPDGDVALGTFQSDAFASHTHGITIVGGPGSNGVLASTSGNRGAGNDGDRYSTTYNTLSINNTGGNETRMKNVTVNYFIRIN